LFDIFVEKFAIWNNAKKREISNSIIIKIKNFNNVVKKNNNKQETQYKIQDNTKELSYNYYVATNNNNNSEKNNKNEKNKDNSDKIDKNNNNKNNNEIKNNSNQTI